jgi:short-subunit dehydrogenase
VQVSVVFPGAIATNIMANSGVAASSDGNSGKAPTIKMTSAKAAAEIIVDGMEKNKYLILVGSDAKTMDFLYRLMPERAAKMIYSQMRSLLPE